MKTKLISSDFAQDVLAALERARDRSEFMEWNLSITEQSFKKRCRIYIGRTLESDQELLALKNLNREDKDQTQRFCTHELKNKWDYSRVVELKNDLKSVEGSRRSLSGAIEVVSILQVLATDIANNTSDIPSNILNMTSFRTMEQLEYVHSTGKNTIAAYSAWLVNNRVYAVIGTGVPDDVQSILARKAYENDIRKVDEIRAAAFRENNEEEGRSRRAVPERVRQEVWRRDNGQCVKCDSRLNLEFDHIVPVSRGGSNTARNIELLCESCNRRKSDKIM